MIRFLKRLVDRYRSRERRRDLLTRLQYESKRASWLTHIGR